MKEAELRRTTFWSVFIVLTLAFYGSKCQGMVVQIKSTCYT